jgi:lambda repressor-like predicted transcriptional regulator
MSATDIRHGTITSYTKHRCRCDRCTAAWRVYGREAYRRSVGGRRMWIPPDPCRRHVEALLASGMSQIAIAESAGVSRRTLENLLKRRQPHVHSLTADKLMSVCADDWPDGVSSPASEAVHMLELLHRAGVRAGTIATVLHVTCPERIRHQKRVRPQTRQKLRLGVAMAARDGLLEEEAS